MKKVIIYGRTHVVRGSCFLDNSLLSHVNRFDTIQLKPEKVRLFLQDSDLREEFSQAVQLSTAQIMLISVQE